jgi:hypothetical protein
MKEFVMYRFVKSLVVCSAVVGGSLFAAAPQAEAGWGISFYNGSPGYYAPGYYGASPYYGGYGGYGINSFYGASPAFRYYGNYSPWGGYGGYHHHHHCR